MIGHAETHISRVFFTEDRAYKLLKSVDAGFVDFTSSASRLEAAERELELNRRLAPDVYLGLADIREDGELVDRMLVMRRMPSERRLEDLLAGRSPGRPGVDVGDCLREIARAVAALHESSAPLRGEQARMATRDSVARHWEQNFAAIEPHVGSVIDRDEFDEVRRLAQDYLQAGEALFRARVDQGWIRDGHGDLRAEDIFCLDDGPRILDCLAFSDEYRISDVLADIGFLVMDVIHFADASLAAQLMDAYVEFSGESHPASLADHYVAYRAHVRVKIACLRCEQGDDSGIAEARALHGLALERLRRARRRMVIVGGGPGTGKSTLARGLSDRLGLALCSSDETRKELAGLSRLEDASAAPGEGIYTTEMTERTYRELLRRAELLLDSGESVVLDASWSARRHRSLAHELAQRCGAELVQIECRVPVEVAKRRISSRRDDPSDATAETVDAMAAHGDPWPEAAVVDTSRSPDHVVDEAVELLGGPRNPPH